MEKKLTILLFLVLIANNLPVVAEQKAEKSEYYIIAERIIEKIYELKSKHPCLAEIKKPHPCDSKFGCTIHYRYGIIGEYPNPEWKPNKKVAKTMPIYAEDGIALSVYFTFGQELGACSPPPLIGEIGLLKIYCGVDGPMGEIIKNEIIKIVKIEKRIFEKNN